MADQQLELYHERRKKRKRAAAGFFVTVVAVAQHIYCRRRIVELGDFSEEEAEIRTRKQMLRNIYLGPNQYCYDTLRFTKRSFFDLCAILRERVGLEDSFYMTVEEAVTIFLLVLSHGMKFRLIRSTYRWTLEPISRHFNVVLGAILSLSHEIIKLPNPATELPEDHKWKWFPDALGALDGTHVDVRVPLRKQGRYRNRKKAITTNVLGVCDRNMKFVYVLAGLEGSASDGRVLRDAMFREDSFKVPNGKYYLVDAGYTNGPGFFAPFRNTRYHLKEWAANGNNPETAEELYNLRHAIARNVVERIWALLKMRWATLRASSFFGIKNQIRVINACCILHNFLADRQREMDDLMLQAVDNQLNNAAIDVDEPDMITHIEVTNEWNNRRLTLANQMWDDYQARRGQANGMDSGLDSRKKGRSYLKWTDEMDKAMLDVFVEYYSKGDRAQNGWKPHVYTAAVKKVREKCQFELTKENIISRSKTFDKHYVIVNKMLSQSGFGWDDEKNMVIVEDDVWDIYVKANKDAASYRYKVIKYWDMISTLYCRDRATGVGARTANESAAEMSEENANTTTNNKDANSSTKDDEDRPKKRYRSDDSIAAMLGDKLDKFTDVFKADAPEPPPKPATPEEIWALLGDIPDLEDDQLLAIYDVLVADDRKFKSLVALPEWMKKKWVLKQINA